MKRTRRLGPVVLLAALIEALAPVGDFIQPVVGAGRHDWNPASFWHGNWGASGVHKGIDIFAKTGTPVVAAQSGLVLYTGNISLGGNVALLITPRGWLHYYAHLNRIDARSGRWLAAGAPVGTVGATGDAVGRPAHLHYSVLTLVPRPWDFRLCEQGWKRMFYRNPDRLLEDQST
jgi:murein DD-endopeptidase MepM/ murein hydrolase activator NlpD